MITSDFQNPPVAEDARTFIALWNEVQERGASLAERLKEQPRPLVVQVADGSFWEVRRNTLATRRTDSPVSIEEADVVTTG